MLNKKIEILSLWIIIKILLFEEIKTFEINQIKQTQKNKTLDENINVTNSVNHNKTRKLQTANYEPIRIYIDTYQFDAALNIGGYDSNDLELIYKALNKAKNTLEKLIKVQRESNVISADDYKTLLENNFRQNYFNNEISSNNLLQEIDLVILIEYKMLNAPQCSEFPKILKRKNEIERPIVGCITFDPTKYSIEVSDGNKYRLEFFSYFFLHQFTHILGFNKAILGNKIISKDYARINPEKPINRAIINSPKLMEFAEKYFNCSKSEIEGIELEEIITNDEPGCDENLIHWDARILLGDYMTAFKYVQDQAISEFTLALLEDT